MPKKYLILIVICVVAAAATTVWVGALIAASGTIEGTRWYTLLPIALLGLVAWRLLAESNARRNRDD